ncbi:ABC transporter ATP-binding protein [Pseudonocardia nematodicida]|uniref:ABC transporter ATP-binding protein n=1 Tax=Pseudonocardia nematodicida TaxID=1206997 RepID=A0ABV1KEV3_9PSEU
MDVKIKDLSLAYGDVAAVDHLSLDIADGESLVLLGQSGCGKTSTMRCVAGLEDPDAGSITIGGRPVFDADSGVDVAPNKRNVGLVFQSYAVWPHMTVIENVSFPLKMKRRARKEIRTRALETLELVGLAHLADKGASLLSGGQMQRVALARSLAMEPNVMLLDEPLSNLDARLREDLRVELRRLQLELGLTSIYVTHDQGEALALADRIAIMQDGRIAQLATPVDTYRSPASASIAQFLGVANIFRIAAPEPGARRLRLADHDLEVVVDAPVAAGTGEASVCVRPEHVRLTTEPAAGPNTWPGTVLVSVFQGSFARATVALDAGPTLEVQTAEDVATALRQHDRVHVGIDPRDVQVLPQEVGGAGAAPARPVAADTPDDGGPAHDRPMAAHAATASREA